MTKKYFVSLAVKVPQNFEGEVEAENEIEAQDLAIEIFEGGNWEKNGFQFVDDVIGDEELDLRKLDKKTKIYDGVYIEEL